MIADEFQKNFDSVILENYIRPGGTEPQTVIIVRDPSQLRSPDATFNPDKRGSWNIMSFNHIPGALRYHG